VTKMVVSVRNKGKLQHWRKNYQLFILRVFVLRDDFSEQINRVIRGFALHLVGLLIEHKHNGKCDRSYFGRWCCYYIVCVRITLNAVKLRNSRGAESFLKKLTGPKLMKNYPNFIETVVSLSHPQAPATCPSPEPHQSSPYLSIPLPKDTC
jgi:hypothetical protein